MLQLLLVSKFSNFSTTIQLVQSHHNDLFPLLRPTVKHILVALNYGVFRRAEFNTSAVNVMFYDVGASSAVATVVCKLTV